VTVEGLEHLPASGPLLIVARHFHHLYDGCVLLTRVPRRTHILVALDWVQSRRTRFLMELVCSLASWPVVLRSERLSGDAFSADQHKVSDKVSVYSADEITRYMRRGITEAVRLLRAGEALVIFPEGYPTIDPVFTPKQEQDSFLPFRPGFAKIVEMAERDGTTHVAVVPAGFSYEQRKRWQITLRLGPALYRKDFPTSPAFVQALEQQVHELSC
jgi:1-acyl-sn-glycerol-3-phosphate acyltransferase